MSDRSLVDRAVGLGLRCYPSWWRDRYGAEQEALIEDLRADHGGGPWAGGDGWRVAVGFLLGAARARITGAGMPPVPELWQRRARTEMVAASVSAAVALPLAVLVISHASERMQSGPGGAVSAARMSTAVQVAYWDVVVLEVVVFACFVQLLAGAVGLSRQVLAAAPRGRRVLVAIAAAAPVLAIGGGLALRNLAASLRPVVSGWETVGGHVVHISYSYRGHPVEAAILHWLGWVGLVGGWASGMVILTWMASRHQFALRSLADAVLRTRTMAYLQIAMVLNLLVLAATVPFQPTEAGRFTYSTDLGAWTPVVFTALAGAAGLTLAATHAARSALGRGRPSTST